MPTKERRAKEKVRGYEKDGDYGQVDCGYVFGNPGFAQQSPACKLAEILAWLACFKERDDVLKPGWQVTLRSQVGIKMLTRWSRICNTLVTRGCWEILQDGSLKVLRIKEKRPNFPWKGKGQKGQNEGTKTGNIESITLSYEASVNALASQDSPEVEKPIIRPTLSVADGLKKILAAKANAMSS